MVALLVANRLLTGVPKMMPATRPAASLWRPSVTWLQTSSVIDTFAWRPLLDDLRGALRHPDIDEQIASR
jgi:hypothetical protein